MEGKSAKKLGKLNAFFGWTNLYSLNDHLLVEKIAGYSAEYRRFFYDDIISIITYINPSWKIKVTAHSILAAIAISIISWLILSKSPIYSVILTAIFTGPLWILLLLDLILGPTSKGQIRTVTSTEEIILAKRYRKSKKILQRIQSLIEERQGILDTEPLFGKPLEYKSPLLIPQKVHQVKKKKREIPTSKYNRLYSFFLIVLFLKVIVSSLQLRMQGDIAIFLSSFLVLVIIVNAIVLFKQDRLYIRRPLRILSWVSMIIFLSSIAVSFILGIIVLFDYGLIFENQFTIITQTDHRFLLMKMVYLGLEILLVACGSLISLRGQHSIYSNP